MIIAKAVRPPCTAFQSKHLLCKRDHTSCLYIVCFSLLIPCSCRTAIPFASFALNLLGILLSGSPSNRHTSSRGSGSCYCRRICSSLQPTFTASVATVSLKSRLRFKLRLLPFLPTLHPSLCEAFKLSTWPLSLVRGVYGLQSLQDRPTFSF